jgi:RHS repeat-associated protein
MQEHSGTDLNAFLFTGETLDPGAQLYFLRARWLSPGDGRLLSVDPYAGGPQQPSSLHRYLYVWQNPLNNIDPSGLQGINETGFVSAISGYLRTQVLPALTSIYLSAITAIYMTPIFVERFCTWADRLTIVLGTLELLNMATSAWLSNTQPISNGPSPRGFQLEAMTGKNLGKSFPKIDDFRDGVGTSIKSHAVGSPRALVSSIRRDLRDLVGIESRTLQGLDNEGNQFIIKPGEIATKVLVVAIPESDALFLSGTELRGALEEFHETYETVIRVVPVRGWK